MLGADELLHIRLLPYTSSPASLDIIASEGTSQYPTLISRSDVTMLPSSSSPQKGLAKSRPPPLKLSGSSHETFLSPLLDRPFLARFTKDKLEGPPDGDGADATRLKLKRSKSKSELKSPAKADTGLPSSTVQPTRVLSEVGPLKIEVGTVSLISSCLQDQMAFFMRYPDASSSSSVRTASLSPPPPAVSKAKDVEGSPSRRTRSEEGNGASQRSDRVPVPSLDDVRFQVLFPTALAPVATPSTSSAPSTLRSSTPAPPIDLPRPSSAAEETKLLPSASIVDGFEAIERHAAAGRRTTPMPLSPPPRRHSHHRPHHHSPPTTPRSRNQSSPSIVHIPGPSPALQGSLRSRSASLSISSAKPIPAYAADAFYAPTPAHRRLPLPSFPLSPPTSAHPSIGISVRDSAGERPVSRASYGPEGVSVTLRSDLRPEEVEIGWTCITGTDAAGEPFSQWELKLRPKVPLFSDYRLATIPPLPSRDAPTSPLDPRAPPPVRASTTHASSASSLSSESSLGPTTPRRSRFVRGPSSDEQEGRQGLGEVRSPANHRFGCYVVGGEGGEGRRPTKSEIGLAGLGAEELRVLGREKGRKGSEKDRKGSAKERKGSESKWSESEGETEESGGTSWSWVRGEEEL